ncbi:ParB/RepB/Spo0J family partition protein [Antarctobacter jejuensis]|uniref:ParB/RepB/Spo0J family partition protein n=1 Tax=Antarctobacter jejuensis TaxID=1439938 RepID=UPI003FCF656E
MTDTIIEIPLTQINADALPGDRSIPDPQADFELMNSIMIEGLRHPIEVYEYSQQVPEGHRYGLISGFRRLAAFKALDRETVPAVLRTPEDIPKAVAAMVTENEIRSQITPWEKARLILQCLDEEIFATADEAINALFRTGSRQKRARLRGLVPVVEAFDGFLNAPERLTARRLDQLTAALNAGFEDAMQNALGEFPRNAAPETQWEALSPVIHEALNPRPHDPAPDTKGDPRRVRTIRNHLTIRRELTRTGWILRFSGKAAKSPGIIDDVMDYVEQMFGTQG